MSGRKELIELEFLAKVHALKRDKQSAAKSPAATVDPTPEPQSAESDSDSKLLVRLRTLPAAFSWKGLTEKAFVRLTQIVIWLYVVAVLAVWFVLHFGAQRGWLSMLVLLGPRWLLAVPLIALIPLATMLRARLLLPLSLVGMLTCFAVVGVCLPWPWQGGVEDEPGSMMVVTCDVHGPSHNWQRVQQLFATQDPDIVGLQRFDSGKLIAIPRPMHVFMEGELVIASRYPFLDKRVCNSADPANPNAAIAIYSIVDTPSGPLGVCNLQLTSLADELDNFVDSLTDSDVNTHDRLRQTLEKQDQESQRVAQWLEQLPQVDIILGSFGMPVESRGYRCWDKFDNAFSQVGYGLGFTQRVTAHRIGYGLRTDHILVGDRWSTLTCEVGLPVGSEHLPLLARVRGVVTE